MDNLIKRSFSINLQVMRIFGLYSPEKFASVYKIYAYLMYFISLVPLSSLGSLYFILEQDIDWVQASYNAFLLAATACYIIKLLPFITNGDRIKRCIHYFESPLFEVFKDEQKRIVEDCCRICRRNSVSFFGVLTASFCSWAIKPFFWEDYKLPIDVWLPFDPIASLMVYYSVFFLLALGVGYGAFITAATDPLIGGLAYHAASQLKVLKDNLQNLQRYANEDKDTIYEKIKRCIEHHNAILDFVDEYEECFSLAVFSQFVGSIFIICLCCLQLSKLPLNMNFVMMVMYLGVALGQTYFYCYYGTILFEEGNSLTNAVYMGKWYDYDAKSKKALVLLMERAKRPMIVTAGKILDLSLETFTTILRRSYSLLAVLKNY